MIDHVGWAVQPQSTRRNRAALLVSGLKELGTVSEDCTFSHHGKSLSTDSSQRVAPLVPRLAFDRSPTAVLSPVFCNIDLSNRNLVWFDAYDDWSIAPDINAVYRKYARINYSRVRRAVNCRALVTVNSTYMAWKLGLPNSSVVPNGVDADLWKVEAAGDSQVRIVMLGHFFDGRTDYGMIQQIAEMAGIDEIVIAGLGRNGSANRIRELLRNSNARVVEHSWLTLQEVGRLSGINTVGVIPHVVSDYTVSQNLMKAFQFISLGLPIVCPLLLWPPQIDVRFAYLVGHGASLSTTLLQWIKSVERPDSGYRHHFTSANSWIARAEDIAGRLEDGS